MPQFLATTDADFDVKFQSLLSAKREDSPDVDAVVAEIIADVRNRGDAAVLDLTARFDRLQLTADDLRLSPERIKAEIARVPEAEATALHHAADRIAAYHSRQMPTDEMWQDETGRAFLT